jgi:hypothetical protein
MLIKVTPVDDAPMWIAASSIVRIIAARPATMFVDALPTRIILAGSLVSLHVLEDAEEIVAKVNFHDALDRA